MISAITNMLPGIVVLAIVVAYQIAEERACNRFFKRERDKWKEGRHEQND